MGDIAFFVLFLLIGNNMQVAPFDALDACQTVLERVSKRPDVTAIGECQPIRMRVITRSEPTTK